MANTAPQSTTAKLGWGSYLGTTHRLLVDVSPVRPPQVGLADLSVVTGASFRVSSSSRGVLTWAAVLLAPPTPKLVRLAHVYAAGDLTVVEQLVVTPILTVPGDVVDCVPVLVSVVAY
jgi:hypothetical protein